MTANGSADDPVPPGRHSARSLPSRLGSLLSRWGSTCLAFVRSRSFPISCDNTPAAPLGSRGEQYAEKFLRSQGWKILARNLKTRLGEIDLLALDGATVVFIEVKTRLSDHRGRPEEAVDRRKQKQLSRVAMGYLKERRWLERPSRIDVIAITGEPEIDRCELRHFKNAFPAAR